MSLLEQTAVHVNAFERNMRFGRLDAGLVNLDRINDLIDAKDAAAQQNGASDE